MFMPSPCVAKTPCRHYERSHRSLHSYSLQCSPSLAWSGLGWASLGLAWWPRLHSIRPTLHHHNDHHDLIGSSITIVPANAMCIAISHNAQFDRIFFVDLVILIDSNKIARIEFYHDLIGSSITIVPANAMCIAISQNEQFDTIIPCAFTI